MNVECDRTAERSSWWTRSKDRRAAVRGGHRVALVLCVAVVLGSGGCTQFRVLRDQLHYNETVDDLALGWRNYVWARRAWHREKAHCAGHPQLDAFGEGFRAGYKDVASGGNGCVPPMPPREYWGYKYQSAEGQAKVAAWFEGFPHGVRAAGEDGAGNWSEIQVSHHMHAQYSPMYQEGFDYPYPDEFLPPEMREDGEIEESPEVVPAGPELNEGAHAPTRSAPTSWSSANMTRLPAISADGYVDPVSYKQAIYAQRNFDPTLRFQNQESGPSF